jgi:hypothetical protein
MVSNSSVSGNREKPYGAGLSVTDSADPAIGVDRLVGVVG